MHYSIQCYMSTIQFNNTCSRVMSSECIISLRRTVFQQIYHCKYNSLYSIIYNKIFYILLYMIYNISITLWVMNVQFPQEIRQKFTIGPLIIGLFYCIEISIVLCYCIYYCIAISSNRIGKYSMVFRLELIQRSSVRLSERFASLGIMREQLKASFRHQWNITESRYRWV